MSQKSRWEYLRKIYHRYRRASAHLKRQILDEFCANCGYHRKYAIRLLHGPLPGTAQPQRRKRRSYYGSQLISVLSAIWESAGYPWSVRLKALLPHWLPWARQRFHLTPALEKKLLRISPRTIDYRLQAKKRQGKKKLYGRTKPGTLLKHHIPIKTDRWDVQWPGFSEVDLVSHSGSSASGDCCHSLNLTDIHTTWVETRAVWGKGQTGICRAMEEIRQALPFQLRGIDSDNGSEFINRHLYQYCQNLGIQFTRGRPYKKDDNAHIEQKNWTHVRRLLGYDRYDSAAALEALNDLYCHELRLFQNLFLPSVKLVRKVRVGSRSKRVYDPPQTPLERVGACKQADPLRLAQLQQLRHSLDPFQLSETIERKLERIFQLAASASRPGPNSQASGPQFSQLSTGVHRKKKEAKKKESKAATAI